MKSLDKLREDIATIDKNIVDLIAKRTALSKDIAFTKREMGLSPLNEEQIEIGLERVVRLAVEKGIDPTTTKKIFELLIEMNVERQREYLGEGNLP